MATSGDDEKAETPEASIKLKPSSSADEGDDGKVKLERSVGLFSGIGLTMGTMIGSGIFATAPGVVQYSGSVGLSLVVWLLCGVIALLGAISYCELCTMITKSGGEYQYLYEAFGPIPAFLFCWTAVVVLRPATVAAIALTFSSYLIQAVPDGTFDALGEWAEKIFALSIILVIAFVNIMSASSAARMQNLFTGLKLIAIMVIIVIGSLELFNGGTDVLATGFTGSERNPLALGLAFYNGLWAYDSWNTATYITEEIKNPRKNLPRALLLGIPLVMIFYLLTNVAYFTVINKQEIISTEAVAVLLGEKTLPNWILWVIPLAVCASTFGATNGCLFAASRLTFAAAREGHLMKILSYCNVSRKTPSVAILFLAFLSCIYVLPSDFSTLVNYFSFAAWIFYGLTVFSVIFMRFSQPNRERPIRVPILIPVLFVIIAAYLVVAPIIDKPEIQYLYAAIFIVSGLPIYYLPVIYCKLRQPKWLEKVITGLQYVLNVAPPAYSDSDDTEGQDDTAKVTLGEEAEQEKSV